MSNYLYAAGGRGRRTTTSKPERSCVDDLPSRVPCARLALATTEHLAPKQEGLLNLAPGVPLALDPPRRAARPRVKKSGQAEDGRCRSIHAALAALDSLQRFYGDPLARALPSSLMSAASAPRPASCRPDRQPPRTQERRDIRAAEKPPSAQCANTVVASLRTGPGPGDIASFPFPPSSLSPTRICASPSPWPRTAISQRQVAAAGCLRTSPCWTP
ncbi:uncharacterized protein UV8b_05974 [Ustilaginoidea virens]|uniref:Uncharacterized protein n=1 Tax=Ustilaginoidea virens TaxID=1159556 RepID=A0A8E5HUF1_USTVR|nr:uncharacterized protein UV8b_05974 [Ustilaginoidea virens]QUC21731.1 hypothetical protein UV8b_05974 [Ustilaginoidea virens]